MTSLRPELPPLPDRLRRLPVDARGYPVPVFVQWYQLRPGADPEAGEPGVGYPDFRVTDSRVLERCLHLKECWICGTPLGRYHTFVAGAMCAVNRTSAEPPQHHDCATWSARACPFLSRPHAKRRPVADDRGTSKPAGIMLERNPGVTVVWTSRRDKPFKVPERHGGGILWHMGPPEHVEWWARGRSATRAEVMESIDTGIPALAEIAAKQAGGLEALERQLHAAYVLLPRATVLTA